ncbi:hypothetical protein RQP46_003165 [Phenoliferia psychrophenolica]
MGKYNATFLLDGHHHFLKWWMEMKPILILAEVYEIAVGIEPRPEAGGDFFTATSARGIEATEAVAKWDKKQLKILGILGINVSPTISLAIDEMKGVAAVAWLRSEYGRRAVDEEAIEWKALQTLSLEDGDDVGEFLQEFQDKVNSLASLGRRIPPEDLFTSLKAALPSSHADYLRNLGYQAPELQTYESLRRRLGDDAKSAKLKEAAEHKTYLARRALVATVEPKGGGNKALVPGQDGILRHASGDVVKCYKRGCGGNHFKSFHRDDKPAAAAVEPAPAPAATSPPSVTRKATYRANSARDEPEYSSESSGTSEDDWDASDSDGPPPNRRPAVATSSAIAQSRTFTLRALAVKKSPAARSWLLDSGSDTHASPYRELLFNRKSIRTKLDGIVDGASIMATVAGDSFVHPSTSEPIKLTEVLHSPAIAENIISLQKLADGGATIVLSKTGGAVVMGVGFVTIAPEAEIIEILRPEGTSWTLEDRSKHLDSAPTSAATLTAVRSSQSESKKSKRKSPLARKKSTWEYIHKSLGHPAIGRLTATVRNGLAHGIDVLTNSPPEAIRCAPCAQAKSKRSAFPQEHHVRAKHRIQLNYGDLMGKSRVAALNGERYAMIIVDDKTRKYWVIGLKKKSEAVDALKAWQVKVERRTGRLVEEFQSDGGELVTNVFAQHCKATGIHHRITFPHTSAMNGTAEKAIDVLKASSRAIHLGSGLPDEFWLESLKYAAWCAERVATSADSTTTSFEAFYKRKPDASLARAFGEEAWPHIPKPNRSTLPDAPRAQHGRFIGISAKSKGWRIVLDDGTVKETRDADFWPDLSPVEELDSESEDEGEPLWTDAVEEMVPVLEPLDAAPVEGVLPAPGLAPLAQPRRSARLDPSVTPLPAPLAAETSSRATSPELPLEQPSRTTRKKLVVAPRSQPRPTRKSAAPDRLGQTPTVVTKRTRLARIQVAKATGIIAPRSRNAALKTDVADKWTAADLKELENLLTKEAVRPARLPEGEILIPVIRVHSYKKDSFGEVVIDEDGRLGGQKVRWVADGSKQVEGIHYFKSYAATAQMTSIRLVIAYAVEEGGRARAAGLESTIEFRVADFKGAYLNAPIDRPQYITIPESSSPELERLRAEGFVWEVRKALYGLCQSGALWAKMRDQLFAALGYRRLEADTAVYVYRDGTRWILVPSHVDDLFAGMNAIALWDLLISELIKKVSFSKIEKLSYHLGANYSILLDGSVVVHLAGFINDVLAAHGMTDCKAADTPMLAGTHVVKGGSPLVSMTIREVQNAHDPTEEHVEQAKRVLRYLKGTKTWGIIFRYDGKGLGGDSDATYASCPDTMKSITGFRVTWNGPIAWGSSRQDDHTDSSGESELYACAKMAKTARGINITAVDMGIRDVDSPPINIDLDSTAAISLSTKDYTTKNMRHVDLKHFQIRRWVALGEFTISYLPTALMPSDLFTKALGPTEFIAKRDLIGMVDVGAELRKDGIQ